LYSAVTQIFNLLANGKPGALGLEDNLQNEILRYSRLKNLRYDLNPAVRQLIRL
jgi:hypothetical protein